MNFARETINEVLLWRLETEGDRPVFFVEDGAGGFEPKSASECRSDVLALAAALRADGLDAGDRIGLLSAVRQEWTGCDFANLLARLVTVGIYPTATAEQVAYILQHSGSRLLIVDLPERLEALAEVLSTCPELEGILLMEGEPPAGLSVPVRRLDDLIEQGRKIIAEQGEDGTIEEARKARSEDLITLVYTSGTTGPPKGAMLTHGNLFHVCDSVAGLLPFGEEDRGIIYLPLAHILQRYVTYLGLRMGGSGYYLSDIPALPSALQVVRPTVLAAVPRVLEKIHAKALARTDSLRGFKRWVFDWAFRVGQDVAELRRGGGRPRGLLAVKHRIADRLVLSKIREKLGGSLELVVSGGAPLARHLSDWFHAAGILVVEGYGLTETAAPVTTNTPDSFRFGTVGQAIPNTRIRIAADGEVEVQGPGVFTGYFRDPETSSAAFTEDGFFRTGDIGELDEDGFLRITDRKKDLIITAGGKNISPANIENLLKEHLLIGQAMVYGDRKPYLVCVLTLDPEDAPEWAAAEGLDERDLAALSRDPGVLSAVAAHVKEVNQTLPPYETIKSWELLDVPFLPENGYLTPTLKLKRRIILRDYGERIEAIYRQSPNEQTPLPPSV